MLDGNGEACQGWSVGTAPGSGVAEQVLRSLLLCLPDTGSGRDSGSSPAGNRTRMKDWRGSSVEALPLRGDVGTAGEREHQAAPGHVGTGSSPLFRPGISAACGSHSGDKLALRDCAWLGCINASFPPSQPCKCLHCRWGPRGIWCWRCFLGVQRYEGRLRWRGLQTRSAPLFPETLLPALLGHESGLKVLEWHDGAHEGTVGRCAQTSRAITATK